MRIKPRAKRRRNPQSAVKVRGFFRLKIVNPDGSLGGDSKWKENTVVNDGFRLYLADNIGKSSGSKQIGYVALGTGGAPAVTDAGLAGELMASTQRKAVIYANLASKTAVFTATFASS